MVLTNVTVAFLLLLVGALVTGIMRSWRPTGWVAAFFVGLSTFLAWSDGLKVLLGRGMVQGLVMPFPKVGAELAVSLDPLGSGFLVLITGVSFLATLYSIGYMECYPGENAGRFYSLLQVFIAAMIGVVSVADWLVFLVFWELMTLASYFLVTFERGNPQAVRAGFKYFIMTHVATAGLLVAMLVLWDGTSSFSFAAHKAGLGLMTPSVRNFLLVLYLLAFSTKAGILPMGDWLPDAHPAAPSGVSAILSGVMIKLGAYGVLRVFWGTLTEIGGRTEVLAWGAVIAFLGALSALVGGLTAMKENDAKRLLAYSSISQTGYIFVALGIAVSFSQSESLPSLALLGLLGAGFHIFNDALYKSLLFMNAGSLLYSTGTRNLNRIGGLSSVMPAAAAAGLVGIVSLSGLPPTNGFASKWLIYQSSISGGLHFAPFVIVAVVIFFVSLTTLAYSLKYYDSAFLGKPAEGTAIARPIPPTMIWPQGVLALACLVAGLAPSWVVRPVASVFGEPLASTLHVGRAGGLTTIPAGGALGANWSPIALLFVFLFAFLIAEAIRNAGRAKTRVVPSWYGGEEHVDEEVRFRAQGLYSPFNEVFANVYPCLKFPRLPKMEGLRSILDLDSWLYGPLRRIGTAFVDWVSRSHVGIPQLYIVWQVGGMIVVLVLLFVLIR